MGSKIIIVGKGGSGKDYLRKKLEARGMKFGVTHTTRKPREGEVDGVDCNFITRELFRDLLSDDKFIEYDRFGSNFYGTTRMVFTESDVFTMTPVGVMQLPKAIRDTCVVIYLDIERDVRRERLHRRGMSEQEVAERLYVDDEAFEGFSLYNIRITNPDF